MVFRGQIIKSRISFVLLVFGFLWMGLFIRSAYLQLIPNKKLSTLQNKLFERTITLKPRRGTIYDRNNKELAISIPSQSLFADPQRMPEPYYTAKKLSKLFNKPRKFFLKKLLNKKRRFVWIKRHLTQTEISKIKSWNLKGLHFLKENKRFYTNENSLSQVLGFTGLEGQGLEGIEKQYEDILKGESQKILIQRDARGRPLFMDFSPFITKISGYDVHLSIDSDLQFYLEKALQKGIKRSRASTAMGVILSADSSEVLAMANLPNYNSNKARQSSYQVRRNRVITDMFEPGSTLKTFTLISALKNGINPTKTYSSHGGHLEIGSRVISEADSKKQFKPFLNMSEILAFSSNVGAAEIALDIGDKNLRSNLKTFGFGEKTGIDFPGESPGLLKELPWRDIETATISFGHGIASTALQIANAYASIANGGILKSPVLVKKIRNPYTGEEKTFNSTKHKRVLSEKIARTLSLMLISVTAQHGTGVLAEVPGYFVAGKTGTAQKVDSKKGGYKKGEYISSFIGFIPAHNPKFVIYLMIDGAVENFYASSLVAPLFSEVASYTVRQAGLSPTLLKETNIISNRTIASSKKQENNTLSNKTTIKMKKINIFSNRVNTNIKEDSLKQSRKSTIKSNNEIESKELILKTALNSQSKVVKPNHETISSYTMPDLRGMSLRQALLQLNTHNLNIKIQGSGQLIESRPHRAEPISKNVTLIFN